MRPSKTTYGERVVKDINRKTRKQYSAEEKIRIVLDDFSRYIISWKLYTTMKTSDVTDTLNMAPEASGYDQAKVVHKPRLLSDNGA